MLNTTQNLSSKCRVNKPLVLPLTPGARRERVRLARLGLVVRSVERQSPWETLRLPSRLSPVLWLRQLRGARNRR